MNKTIVIADDNAALCSGMRDFINSQDGFEVVGVAQNGNDALRLIDLYKPDFVLLDIVMPELDGFGVLSAMENKSSIVIMMSQLASDGFVQKAMQYGASYFLAKPFDYNTALKVINDFSNPRPAQRSQVNVRKNKTLDERIANLFISVGIPAHIKGYQNLRSQRKTHQRRIYRARRRQIAVGVCIVLCRRHNTIHSSVRIIVLSDSEICAMRK